MNPQDETDRLLNYLIESRMALDAAAAINERMLQTGRVEALNLSNHDRLAAESRALVDQITPPGNKRPKDSS